MDELEALKAAVAAFRRSGEFYGYPGHPGAAFEGNAAAALKLFRMADVDIDPAELGPPSA
jgi:hypothetical protein